VLRQENGSGKISFTEFKSKLGKKYSSPEQTLPQNPMLKSSFSQKKSVQFFSSFLLFLLICFPLFSLLSRATSSLGYDLDDDLLPPS
jgi:hypothetical protein